jgi:hypothetical protein
MVDDIPETLKRTGHQAAAGGAACMPEMSIAGCLLGLQAPNA